jgi:formamidopyrimidine-DNA glycosylase
VPELPEVETIVRDLRPELIGRRLTAIKVSPYPMRREWLAGWAAQLLGRRITDVRRRGKWIIISLHQGRHLIVHLGMTGNLTVKPADEPVLPHTHLIANLSRGRKQMRFRDVRRFGSATLVADDGALGRFFQEIGLGPEPFEVDAEYWRRRLATTGRTLKAVLLDQSVVSGVGNIYADESLFQACLHPAQRARDTNRAEAWRLRQAIVRVLNRAIIRRGSTIRDYVDSRGRQGRYQREFRVYDRVGEPCPRCGATIERMRLVGRSTHYCPRCQRLKGTLSRSRSRVG